MHPPPTAPVRHCDGATDVEMQYCTALPWATAASVATLLEASIEMDGSSSVGRAPDARVAAPSETNDSPRIRFGTPNPDRMRSATASNVPPLCADTRVVS